MVVGDTIIVGNTVTGEEHTGIEDTLIGVGVGDILIAEMGIVQDINR